MRIFARTIVAAGTLILASAGGALATPVTYTFSGTAGGYACVTCTGSDNTNFSGSFSLVVTADTSAIDTSGNPYFKLLNVDATFTDGSFSAVLTGVTVESNADPSFHNINFFNNTFLNGLGFTDAALTGYDLSTSIGPITDSGSNLTPTFDGGFFTTTGSNQVYFTSNSSLTFQADVQSVPEPSAVALFATGLLAFGMIRRRRPG